MRIETEKFGEIEIDENLIFDFISPILGYENLKMFVLVDHMPDSPFKWLQSMEDKNVAFPITIPGYFGFDYQFVIEEEHAKKMGLTSSENLLTFNIVCIPPGNPQAATINLAGPIIINTSNKMAMQLVLVDDKYPVKASLFANANAEQQAPESAPTAEQSKQ